MANTSLQPLHHPLLRRHNPFAPPESLPTTLFLKPTTTPSPTSTTQKLFTTFSLPSSSLTSSSSSTPTSTTSTISFDQLLHHLSTQNFRQADEETRRLIIVLAGEAAQKRGYVFFSEVQFISEADLLTIDSLWREHSNGKFGYSVQKRIWEKKAKRDFTKFFMNVGWMKKLDTEMEQYNYRAFPDEFIWELKDDTPEGHLPLTNALRGTQLLNNILKHPAFQFVEEEGVEGGEEKGSEMGLEDLRQQGAKPMSRKSLKPDYSF
ncbi:tetrapyrrole-binding protein [Cinnamomum micranthum f. kanehirae]|uniref:Tetrapyrrole-binding protein n=1 Tax=Cinnamomum micranthum f. kanehirae TaxID=337451 RepID=A0A3S3R885_9MAGN|nr:tetrapyrrole-binding protein [Cinnamomum micranthum f. kanehirae]